MLGILAALVAAVLLALAGVLATGLDWVDPPGRSKLEERLSTATGRSVAIDGPIRLHVGMRPTLSLEDVRIAATAEIPGGASPAIRLARMELRLGLARSVHARKLEILRFALTGIEYQGTDPGGRARSLRIDAIEGQAPARGPLSLSMRGQLDGIAMQAELDGGTLSDLLYGPDPWPVTLAARFDDARLVLAGALAPTGGQGMWPPAGLFHLGLASPDVAASLGAFGMARTPLHEAGALAARLRLEADRSGLEDVRGTLGASQFDGRIEIAHGGARPLLGGRIEASMLDMRPLLGQPGSAGVPAGPESEVPQTLLGWYQGLDDAEWPLAWLRLADADLELAIHSWLGMPSDVGAVRARARLVDGQLDAPLQAQVAGVELSGELRLRTDSAAALQTELAVGAIDTPLGGLAHWLFGVDDVYGALGGFAMRMTADGATLRELIDTTRLRVVAVRGGFTYGNAMGERPVSFELGRLVMYGGAGEPLRLDAEGTLLDEPIALQLQAGLPREIVRHAATPLSVRASSRSARLTLDGEVAAAAAGAARDAADLRIVLQAGDARDLAGWLGLELHQALPLALSARWHGTPENWQLEPVDLRLAGTRFSVRLARDAQPQGAHFAMRVSAPQMDIDEIARLFASAARQTGPVRFDVPILPVGLELVDLDLDIEIGRIVGGALPMRDLRFATRIRDGFMTASPLSLTVLGLPLAGALELDLRGAVPALEWWLAGADLDIGRVLQRLGLGERVEARFAALVLHLSARGSQLGDLLEGSTLDIAIEGGRLRLHDPAGARAAGFDLATGSIVAAPGEAVRAALAGHAGQQAVALAFQTAPLRALVDPARELELVAEAALGGARIALEGTLARPLGSELRLATSVSGEDLAGWSELLGIALPDWGPYSLAGEFRAQAAHYELAQAQLRLGASRAAGTVRLDTATTPPRLELDLRAAVLDLHDLAGLGGVTGDGAALSGGNQLSVLGAQAGQASEDLQRLLDPDTLGLLDARLALDVELLRAGSLELGSARMHAELVDARVRIAALEARLGQGRARLALDYVPQADPATRVDVDLDLTLEQVDYGLLARVVHPKSRLSGRLDLQLGLHAQTPSLAQAMKYGDGALRFVLWPQDLRTDLVDLWAGNLFLALVKRFGTDSGSTINCARADFGLADGLLRGQRMLIDTSRARIYGTGEADLRSRTLSLRFRPWPKRAEFFSLATPLEVDGSLDAFKIGPRAGEVALTALRLLGSIVWVPMRKLVEALAPDRTSEVCDGLPSAEAGAARELAPRSRTRARRSFPAVEENYFYPGGTF